MIPAGRFSMDGDTPCTYSMEDMFPASHLRDVTEDLEKRFFIPFPKKSSSQVAKASACIIGGQGCGKSVLIAYWADMAVRKYGTENVHIIHTDDIRVALDVIDDTPVQLIIVDDAMTYASSRQVFKQTEIVKVYNKSRHVFEERLNGKPGLILYIWAWQRFGELDPAFRQGDVLVFKTGMAEPSERKLITSFLGTWYTRILYQIWDRINRGNNLVKSTSIGCIASMDPAFGVGIYRSELTDFVLPEMIRSEEYFSDERTENEILDKYRDDPVWSRRIMFYEMIRDGKTQTEVSAATGVNQGSVSAAVKKVRELIAKK